MTYYQNLLNRIFKTAVEQRASDIHFGVGHLPIIRISRMLVPLVKEKKLFPEDLEGILKILVPGELYQRFLEEKELDFSYIFEQKVRFRGNAFFQKGKMAIALRLIPSRIPTIEELNLPPILHDFARHSQGFVLITGPSSHGKSTTLAALIDEINHKRTEHIITIEDPIEYVFEDDKSIVDQREVGKDTLSFARALRATFREDPDVIMVGEMRDPETISTALTAAETGHLVFATLHTNSAAQTIHRIVNSFPGIQQSQIRAQLSGSLLGIVSQRLIPRIRGGLIPACEILISNSAVETLIRENKIHEIPLVIETSADIGMISLDRSLVDLVRSKEITLNSALKYSLNPKELRGLLGE